MGSSSKRPVVLWKTLPAGCHFRQHSLTCRWLDRQASLLLRCSSSVVRKPGIPTSPALTELLSAPNPTPKSDSKQEGHRTKEDSRRKHGRLPLLHADNQHSRRMDKSCCGHCE